MMYRKVTHLPSFKSFLCSVLVLRCQLPDILWYLIGSDSFTAQDVGSLRLDFLSGSPHLIRSPSGFLLQTNDTCTTTCQGRFTDKDVL